VPNCKAKLAGDSDIGYGKPEGCGGAGGAGGGDGAGGGGGGGGGGGAQQASFIRFVSQFLSCTQQS